MIFPAPFAINDTWCYSTIDERTEETKNDHAPTRSFKENAIEKEVQSGIKTEAA
jgi:hypothetical protein